MRRLRCAFLVAFAALGGGVTGCGKGMPEADAGATPDLTMPVGGFDMAKAPPTPCEIMKLPAKPFAPGPYGSKRDSVADDFTVTDQNGDWTLSKHWSGCESYVFVPDGLATSPLDKTPLWAANLDALLAASPPNVHYFFVSTRAGVSVPAELKLVSDQMAAALGGLPAGAGPGQRDWWKPRLHLVQTAGKQIQGWVGDVVRTPGASSTLPAGFAIDRFQRLRELGSLADVNLFDQQLQSMMQWPWDGNLAYAANPPVYFNYEADREVKLAAENAPTLVKIYDHVVIGGAVMKDVVLPDAKTMAGFDTLDVDLTMNCPNASTFEENNGNCGAWDYIVDLEVLEKDGKTWHEVARFISSYHRAGRYLVDASHSLPELSAGGTRHFRYTASPDFNPQMYDTVLTLRFHTEGKAGAPRPTQAVYLFSGGGFDQNYDVGRMPVAVAIPKTARKVELQAILTGHGGATKANCAEFCDHQHQFTVGAKTYLKEFTEVADPQGCMAKIGQGQVPNQSGTWWFGRGGWCPGMQVDPWVVDVTDAVTPGATTMVSYVGWFQNKPPTTGLGNIDLSSWLVIYE